MLSACTESEAFLDRITNRERVRALHRAIDTVVGWCEALKQDGAKGGVKSGTVETALVAASETPSAHKKPMRREDANAEAKRLAKRMKKSFFALSETAQAKLIGTTWKTWSRTEFYKTAKREKARLASRAGQEKSARPPRRVPLTETLAGLIPQGEAGRAGRVSDERDSVLKELAGRENQVKRKWNDLSPEEQANELADYEANLEPSELDDDPPDRPRRIRASKRP
jgi:hypothetical protein